MTGGIYSLAGRGGEVATYFVCTSKEPHWDAGTKSELNRRGISDILFPYFPLHQLYLMNIYKIIFGPWNHSDSSITGFRS